MEKDRKDKNIYKADTVPIVQSVLKIMEDENKKSKKNKKNKKLKKLEIILWTIASLSLSVQKEKQASP